MKMPPLNPQSRNDSLCWGQALGALSAQDVEMILAERKQSDPAVEFFERGYLLARQGRHQDAIKSYDAAWRLHPNDAEILYDRACSFMASRQWGEARLDLEMAIVLQPRNPLFQANLSHVHLIDRDVASAKKTAQCAIELNPRDYVGRFNLAHAFVLGGDRWHARKLYRSLGFSVHESLPALRQGLIEDLAEFRAAGWPEAKLAVLQNSSKFLVPRIPIPLKIQRWKTDWANRLATGWRTLADRLRDEVGYRRWILYKEHYLPLRRFLRHLLASKPDVPQGVPALLGMALTVARNETSFFGFFNLEPVGTEPPTKEGILTIFKPSGPAFRELTTLQVETDLEGVIRDLRLRLARTFVDDPRSGIFAADIAQSFLLSSVGAAGNARVSPLALEIRGRAGSTAPIITGPGEFQTKLRESPSIGYQIYRGKNDTLQIGLPKRVRVTLANVREESGLFLQIRAASGASA